MVIYIINPIIVHVLRCFGKGKLEEWLKIVIGMGFAFASILLAAYLEIARRASPVIDFTSNCSNGVPSRALGAGWMLFSYFLMAMGTLYVVPALFLLSYREVPATIRSLTVVTNIFMQSSSNSLVSSISLFMKEYAPDNLDQGRLEYLYMASMVVCFVLLGSFNLIFPNFRRKTYEDTELQFVDTDEDLDVFAPRHAA